MCHTIICPLSRRVKQLSCVAWLASLAVNCMFKSGHPVPLVQQCSNVPASTILTLPHFKFADKNDANNPTSSLRCSCHKPPQALMDGSMESP